MRNDEYDAFCSAWSAAHALYGRNVSDPVLRLAWLALRRFELPDITGALTRHVTDPDVGQYPPKPADIVRVIEGTRSSRGMVAWSVVERTLRSVGAYETVVFDDPLIHAVIRDMGGWIELARIEADELPFRAREFERRYQGYALRPPADYPRQLTGIAEGTNRAGGHAIGPPVLIGDPARAAMAYRGGGDPAACAVTRIAGPVDQAMAALVDRHDSTAVGGREHPEGSDRHRPTAPNGREVSQNDSDTEFGMRVMDG